MLTPLLAVGVTRYHRPQKNYTTIRNSFVRNASISLRAFRVGVVVLSHAAGFIQTQAQLATACDMSVTTVRAALADLRRDGYLVSRVIREHGRVVGTAYAISDAPFTREEVAALTSEDVPSGPCTDSVPTESVPPKKTRSRRDSSPVEEDQPSGGAAGAASVEEPESAQEEPMPTATDPAQAQLFDLPSTEPPAAEARKPVGAQLVVSAYVEAWREINAEGEPLKAHKGRIARDAKALLTKREATEEELVASARAMAATPFCNLAVQLNIHRRGRGRAGAGNIPPVPQHDPGWVAGDLQQAQELEQHAVNPSVAALRDRYLQGNVA
jgi:hypothetical protein